MSSKRYVTVPPTVQVVFRQQEGPVTRAFTFADFLETPLDDERWGASRATLRQAERVEDAFTGKVPGDVVELEYPDWFLLEAAVSQPRKPYAPAVVRQVLTYLDAVIEAVKEDPCPASAPTSTPPARTTGS